MKTPKFQRGWFFLPALVAVAITAMIGVPAIQAAKQLRTDYQAVYNDPSDANVDKHQAAMQKTVKTVALTATAAGMGTGGDAGDLASQIIGVAVDKATAPQGGTCPAPRSWMQDYSIIAPDGGKALEAIASGVLTQRLIAQINCGAGSNPLPADVTAARPAGCTGGTFVCGNSKVICRDSVCNGSNDCGDNSDESGGMCGNEQSCCQVTNGCPGETGTSCAASCCCCPYGQACDRANPGRGCVASN